MTPVSDQKVPSAAVHGGHPDESPVRSLVRPEYGPVIARLHVPPIGALGPSGAVREWNYGPFRYIKSLKMGPGGALNGFHCEARGGHLGALVHAGHYSDDFSGFTGDQPDSEFFVVHIIQSGWARFENDTTAVTLKPGQVVIRDTSKPWRFWFGPATRTRTLFVPRNQLLGHPVLPGRLPRIIMTDTSVAEVRLLVGFLRLARGFGEDSGLSSIGRSVTEDAGVHFLAATMGAARAAVTSEYANVTLVAAQRFIREHLDDPGLAPPVIARALHVSLRSLHRAFADAEDSVMGYTRRQRLRRARTELMVPGARVSEVAARWQFSDPSHFIRQFKAAYDCTPAAFMKEENRIRRGGTGPQGPVAGRRLSE